MVTYGLFINMLNKISQIILAYISKDLQHCINNNKANDNKLLLIVWWFVAYWSSNTLAPNAKSQCIRKDSDAGERLKAGGEGHDRGWDGWMASPTQWT